MTTSPSPIPDRVVLSADERRPALIEVIRGARREITLSLFRCNDDEILAELTAARARGVAVNVLVTSRSKGSKKRREKLWNALEQTGATVSAYSDPVVKYHAKYLVADDGPAVVASLNLTKKCFRKTCDAIVVTHDPEVVSSLRLLMAADRDALPLPSGLSPRLIIGPGPARRQFTSLIEQARTSIRLIDAKLADPDLVALLKQRRADGIAVDIYNGKRLGALKSHGKIMVVDDRIAVVGSLALAALSLDFRREVAITIEDPAAVAHVMELFAAVEDAQRAGETIAPGEALC